MPGEARLHMETPAANLKPGSQHGAPETLQDMAQKLEKSEAGRKKLRQAISLLKEKLESNEKVLQVNETLRQECAKERQRTEAERKKAEEEKSLREKIEKEGLSTKEQLVRVLQRLDTVERNCKADRNDVERMRKEIKQAVSGLGGAVKAIENAHSSFQILEKNLLGQVSNAVSASSNSSSLVQSAITEAKDAQGAAAAAEKLSQSLVSRVALLQKEGASLDQRVNLLQLELRSRALEQLDDRPKTNEDRLPCGRTSSAWSSNTGVLAKNQQQAGANLISWKPANRDSLAGDAAFSPNTKCAVAVVDSLPINLKLANRDSRANCATPTTEVGGILTDAVMGSGLNNRKQAGRDSVARCGTPNPKVGLSTVVSGTGALSGSHSNDQTPKSSTDGPVSCRTSNGVSSMDGNVEPPDKMIAGSGGRNLIREALEAAKQKRDLTRTTSMRNVARLQETTCNVQRGRSESFVASAHLVKNQREKVIEREARTNVDSGNGSTPAFPVAEKNDVYDKGAPEPESTASNPHSGPGCSPLGSVVGKNSPRPAEGNGAQTKAAIANPLLPVPTKSEERSEIIKCRTEMITNEHKKEKLPVVLLKDITKLFHKEKKFHAKVEGKLAALERVLQSGNDNESPKQGSPGISLQTTLKRKRGKSASDRSRKKFCNQPTEETFEDTVNKYQGVASKGVQESKDAQTWNRENSVVEKELNTFERSALELRPSQLSGTCKAVDEVGKRSLRDVKDGRQLQLPGVEAVPVSSHSIVGEGTEATQEYIQKSGMMDIDFENANGGNELSGGWDTESETEEGFGDDWWARKGALLSPTLPEISPPSLPEDSESNPSSAWPAAGEMSIEDIALFLDVLPSIDQGECDQIRIEETIRCTEDLKVENEGSRLQTAPHGSYVNEPSSDRTFQTEQATGNLSCLQPCPTSKNGIFPPERSLIHVDKSGEFEKLKNEDVLGGYPSVSTASIGDSLPISPVLLPQEAHVIVTSGISVDVGNAFTCTSGVGMDEAAIDSQCAVVATPDISVGLGNALTYASGVGIVEADMDSQCAAKEDQELDAGQSVVIHQSEELCSLSGLELVLGHSIGESKENSSSDFMGGKSQVSIVERTRKILETAGRTQKLLHVALKHTDSDALESNMALVPEIASMFTNSEFSRLDLMCIFTASLVDAFALWDNEKNLSSTHDSKCLEFLIDLVKTVLVTVVCQNVLLPEQALSMFADQLQRFLIQGVIQPLCEPMPEDSVAGCTFHFTPSNVHVIRLTTLISGSKLLATFCERNCKLDFLRNSVYLILRFCDKDSLWLLGAISSFACVCCKSLFSVGKRDVVGQTIRVVISELLNDAEAGREIEHKRETLEGEFEDVVENQLNLLQVTGKETEASQYHPQCLGKLNFLREVIGKEDGLSFEAFVPKLLKSFQDIIRPTFGSYLSDHELLLRLSLKLSTPSEIESKNEKSFSVNISKQSDEGRKPCTSMDITASFNDVRVLEIREKAEGRIPVQDYYWQFKGDRSSAFYSMLRSVNQSEQEAKNVEEWQEMFYDIANSMELVASHLGWDWTYNDLIVEHLWKLVAPGAPPMTVACVAHVFGILGRLGKEVDGTELPGVDELRKSLLVVLSSDQSCSNGESGGVLHTFSFISQAAAAEALIVLSSFNRKDKIISDKALQEVHRSGNKLHAESLKSLQEWFKLMKPEFQKALPASLRCALR